MCPCQILDTFYSIPVFFVLSPYSTVLQWILLFSTNVSLHFYEMCSSKKHKKINPVEEDWIYQQDSAEAHGCSNGFSFYYSTSSGKYWFWVIRGKSFLCLPKTVVINNIYSTVGDSSLVRMAHCALLWPFNIADCINEGNSSLSRITRSKLRC